MYLTREPRPRRARARVEDDDDDARQADGEQLLVGGEGRAPCESDVGAGRAALETARRSQARSRRTDTVARSAPSPGRRPLRSTGPRKRGERSQGGSLRKDPLRGIDQRQIADVERQAARHQSIEHHAERIHVATPIDFSAPRSCSGLMYASVPSSCPWAVCIVVCMSRPIARAMPKSRTFGRPSRERAHWPASDRDG